MIYIKEFYQKINLKIRNLTKIKFVKDVFTLQVGTVISTFLAFLGSIIFARTLGPQNYGDYAIILAFTGIVSMLVNWGVDYATLTKMAEAWEKKDEKEMSNLVISFLKISLWAIVINLIIVFLSPLLSDFIYGNPMIGLLARWLMLASIIRVLFSLIIIILQITRKIKYLTIIENIDKIANIVIPAILVLSGYGLAGLIIGQFITAIIILFLSIYFYQLIVRRKKLFPSLRQIIKNFWRIPVKKYFNFGFWIAIDKNLANLYVLLPMLFMGMFVAKTDIGYFKIAYSYIGIALILLTPVSRLLMVQLPRSKVQGEEKLKDHFFRISVYSFLAVAIIISPMILLSKYLVLLFYGQAYLPTAKIIYWLWPYALLAGAGVGIGSFFRTTNKMKVSITINLCTIIIGAPIVYFLIKNFQITGMVIASIVWPAISTLITFIYIYRNFYVNDKLPNQGNS